MLMMMLVFFISRIFPFRFLLEGKPKLNRVGISMAGLAAHKCKHDFIGSLSTLRRRRCVGVVPWRRRRIFLCHKGMAGN